MGQPGTGVGLEGGSAGPELETGANGAGLLARMGLEAGSTGADPGSAATDVDLELWRLIWH
jgi:hypothetical protein